MGNNGDILQKIISQATKDYKSWHVEPITIPVKTNTRQVIKTAILPQAGQVNSLSYSEMYKKVNLGNDILILTSNDIDVPFSITLTLESQENLFVTTRQQYMLMTYNKYQVFSNYLKIHIVDFGDDIPCQLEFLKITPIP